MRPVDVVRSRPDARTRGAIITRRALAAITLVGILFLGSIAWGATIGERRMARYVNHSREIRNLVSLTWGWRLAREAQANSDRMARLGRLTHYSAESICTYRGENVGVVAPSGTLRGLHRAFMDSETHRANILNRSFRRIGVGIARDSTGLRWVTVVFCRG